MAASPIGKHGVRGDVKTADVRNEAFVAIEPKRRVVIVGLTSEKPSDGKFETVFLQPEFT